MLLPLQLMIMKENGRIVLPCSRKTQKTYVKCTPKESEHEFNSSLKRHGAFFFLGGGGVSRPRSRGGGSPVSTFKLRISQKTVDRTKLRHTPSVSASQALQNIQFYFCPNFTVNLGFAETCIINSLLMISPQAH